MAFEFNEKMCTITDKIFEPLKSFGIGHAGFIKIFDDGKLLRITNNPSWNRKFFESDFYNDFDMYDMQKVPLGKKRLSFLTGEAKSEHTQALKAFDIWNVMIIYKRFSNYGEFWFFSSSKQNQEIINFYVNHFDIFEHFIFYFKEKMYDYINLNDKEALIKTNLKPLESSNTLNHIKIDEYFQKTPIRKYFFHANRNAFLSKREFQCLKEILGGRTSKETARSLGIAAKTVEAHLQNIKDRTNLRSKSDLNKLFKENVL